MRFLRSKKGLEAISIVGTLVLVAFVLFIMLVGPTKIIAQASYFFGTCWGGKLIDRADFGPGLAYDPADWQEILSNVPKIYSPEADKDKICIIPVSEQAKEQLAKEEKEGMTTSKEGVQIIATLDDSFAPIQDGQEVPIIAYRKYTLHLKIIGATDLDNKTCTIHVKGDGGAMGGGTFTFFQKEDQTEKSLLQKNKKLQPQLMILGPTEDLKDTITSCADLEKLEFSFALEEKHVDKLYLFQLLIHSDNLVWDKALLGNEPAFNALAEKRVQDQPLAGLSFNFKPLSALIIEGLPETYARKADLKVTCLVPCTDVTLGLVQEVLPPQDSTSNVNTYNEDIYGQTACKNIMADCTQQPCPPKPIFKQVQNLPPSIDPSFNPDYQPITTPLRPTQSDKSKGAKLQSKFTIDQATLSKTFQLKPVQTSRNTHMCLRVDLDTGDSVIKATQQPLLVDDEAPKMNSALISIHYKTLDGKYLNLNDNFNPSAFVSDAGILVPPEACDDAGGSGCGRIYASYTKIGDIPIQTSGLLGNLLNEAFKSAVTESLSDDKCMITSEEKRYPPVLYDPSRPVYIPINEKGTGYACVYAQDKAGNTGKLVIVKYYNPFNILPEGVSGGGH